MQALEDMDNAGVYRGLVQSFMGLLVIARRLNKVTSPRRTRVAFAPRSIPVLTARDVAAPLPMSTQFVVTAIAPFRSISTAAITPSEPVPKE